MSTLPSAKPTSSVSRSWRSAPLRPGVDHVIPGNDDALKSIHLFTQAIADATIDGQAAGRGQFVEEAAGSSADLENVEIYRRGSAEEAAEVAAEEAPAEAAAADAGAEE